ncbi:MAG TPA: glucose-1-phosphate adenylyltransferase [Holophaga sp.]|nr:glucose-1-phosphate adenylyltransferase [Holophaga sp.]
MSQREVFLAAQRTVAMVLAGGRGRRLHDLTHHLAKPVLDFGGKYRIIDFTLSNCVNSQLRRILVVTQYNSHRLLEHLQSGWAFLDPRLGEFVHVLPAQQSLEGDAWYSGTADAVWQNLENIRRHDPENVLVLAGDHIYKMDYRLFLEDHLAREADVTVACLEVPREAATGFGVVEAGEDGRIVAFEEKPADPRPVPGRPDLAFASMGIYLFKASFLFERLEEDSRRPGSSHDFGKDVIPFLVPQARVFAHRFQRSAVLNLDKPPYWRDVGTVDAYWEANMDLTTVDPELNLYDAGWPIFTHMEQQPPAKFVHSDPHRNGVAISSLVSAGCIVSGATVHKSLLFSQVRAHSHAYLHEAVVLPEADIGRGARLHRVVVDRGCRIPPGLVVGEDPAEDARRFHRTPGGATLVSQRMLDRLQGER